MCFTPVSFGPTKLEIPVRDKDSSLSWTLVNYVRKKFHNIGTWRLKEFFVVSDSPQAGNPY
jgi:hypothetical protein